MMFVNPVNSSVIGTHWVEFTQLITNNYGINYEVIFENIEKSIHFLPFKNIISKYAETLQGKKYPHLHLLSCLCELMKCVVEIVY